MNSVRSDSVVCAIQDLPVRAGECVSGSGYCSSNTFFFFGYLPDCSGPPPPCCFP